MHRKAPVFNTSRPTCSRFFPPNPYTSLFLGFNGFIQSYEEIYHFAALSTLYI